MNPAPRDNGLLLALLDLLLTAMGSVFVAQAFLRHLAAGIQLGMAHKSRWSAPRRPYEN